MTTFQKPDLTALNALYGDYARAMGWLNAEPELEPLGPLHLTGWQRLRRAVEAQTLEDAKRWNDPCTVVMNLEDVVQTGRVTLRVTDYAAVCALRADARETGAPPPVMLSATAVVTGPDGTLLLHQRAITSSTYPGALHTFGGGSTGERADLVALSSRSAMELGCDVAGPPTIELLSAVNTAMTVAPKHRDFDGLIVDLRGEAGSDDVFRAIVGLRSRFLAWLGKQNAVPTSNVPLVLIGGAVELDAARRWSVRRGGPALWFSLGVELVEASEDGVPWQAVRASVDRLKSHPVVQMSTRIHTIFPSGSPAVTCLAWHDGVPAAPVLNDTDRPGEMKELGFPCPSTFELQGGLSAPLPADLREAVVRYCVVALAGDQGRKTGACGYTSLPGRGWWYSEGTGRDIVEGVDWIIVHARVSLAQAEAAAAYLRWAWLQDYVFMTLDGRAVGF